MTTTILSYLLPAASVPAELVADGDGNGPEYTYQPAHIEDGQSLLLSQFNDSTQLRALLASLLSPSQELEDAQAVHYAAFDVDTAEGDLLDVLGGIVGELRAGREDSEYRAYVRARVAANASDGSAADIYRVVRLVLGDDTHDLRIKTIPPAFYRLTVSGAALAFPWDAGVPANTVAKALSTLVGDATSLGVGYALLFQATDDANTFTCSSTDAIEVNANQGCADDAGTVGGQLVDVEGDY